MDYLKTFESFLKLATGTNISEETLFKLIGVNRAIIEDLLVEIEDKLPWAHISIDFTHLENKIYYRKIGEVEFEQGLAINKHNYKEIEKVGLIIRLHPDQKRFKYLLDKYKDEEKQSYKSWHDLILDDEDITDEINSLKDRLRILGFYDVESHMQYLDDYRKKIKQNYLSKPLFSSSSYHPEGYYFLSIRAKKDVIKK